MRDFNEEEIKEVMLSCTTALYNMIKENKAEKDKPIRLFNNLFLRNLGEQNELRTYENKQINSN